MPSWLRIPNGCPASLTLIGITVAIYLAQISTQGEVTNLGVLYGPAVQHGQWWRMISAGFLHGSMVHIAFNMYLLFVLGPQLERLFGSLRFLLIYFGALVGGSMVVMLFDWSQGTLGASGAALGLAGAMGVALYERGVPPQKSPIFGLVVLNLALPLLVPGISFWGHFGGIAAGAFMGYLLIWLPARTTRNPPLNSTSLGVTAIVVFAALGFFAAKIGGLSLG
ncbi:MAG: membrane associated rhomboid family serine protease [Granulosicoccus sp.]